MIILLNTKISKTPLNPSVNYRNIENSLFPHNDRLDIFKYCLSSFGSMIPILSKVILYIELDGDYKNRKDELECYIKEIFPSEMLDLNWFRNNFKSEWSVVCDKIRQIDDDIIWQSCYDDHIFIDFTLETLKIGINHLITDENPYSQVSFSHIPEQIKFAAHLKGILTPDEFYVKTNLSLLDGIFIMKKTRFLFYWEILCHPNSLNFRSDTLYQYNPSVDISILSSYTYIPIKELFRHFDGYGHVGNFNNITPPLYIPEGFFSNNIRVKYGFKDRDNSFTNLNPSADSLYATSIKGTDYRWCIEDIPLFWKNKIVEVIIGDIDENFLKLKRDEYYIDSMTNTKYFHANGYFSFMDIHNLIVPIEWFKKNLLLTNLQ